MLVKVLLVKFTLKPLNIEYHVFYSIHHNAGHEKNLQLFFSLSHEM